MIETVGAGDPRLTPYARVGDAEWLRQQALFVAEGRLVLARVIAGARCRIASVLVTPAALAALEPHLAALDADVLVCGADLLSRVAGFHFHRGCVALVHRPPPLPVEAVARGAGLLVGLEGVGNPDNVGGIFRNAAAFGASGLLVGPATADPLYRKAVRTSMGAVLQLPWAEVAEWPAAIRQLRDGGVTVAALTPAAAAVPLQDLAATRPSRLALLFGAEGDGLREETRRAADVQVRIPIVPGVDSLNVSVAAGIALYALTR